MPTSRRLSAGPGGSRRGAGSQGSVWIALLAAAAALGALPASGASVEVPAQAEAVVARCRADLAQRRKIRLQDVTVAEVRATTWPDAALGLPERGRVYAQQRTPGWILMLKAREAPYLYTASARSFRYGGPLSLWAGSMLYVVPVANEPNLNGELFQCSLLGTNHTRLAEGVSACYPQANGVVLFVRRTSRSSCELWLLNVGKDRQMERLHASFAIGPAALDEAQGAWAALVRPRVGQDWSVVVGRVGSGSAEKQTLPLPEGIRPRQIAWSGSEVLVLAGEGNTAQCLAASPSSASPEWEAVSPVQFPGHRPFLLNKSESLDVRQTGTEDKPSVEVARVWFTGDRNTVATIEGLSLSDYDLVGAGYVLVWGTERGEKAVYAVHTRTGEVFAAFRGSAMEVKPFNYPPVSGPYPALRPPASR